MNRGYRIKKGGLGTVNIIVKLQLMLKNHAKISKEHRRGLDFQSSLIHANAFDNASVIVYKFVHGIHYRLAIELLSMLYNFAVVDKLQVVGE